MQAFGLTNLATWSISALAVLGVIIRPGKLPEALWAVLGAAALVVFSLISPPAALTAVLKGTDVYLFLTGMMLLAEVARQEGLFDWLAAHAVKHSRGSAKRLFALVYAVGIAVTIFLSNDATAVVLTPAVYAAARQARASALPHVFVCAFIANAASFVLPISNPANLVVYGAHMPPLVTWLRQFGGASAAAIGVTYVMLRWSQRRELDAAIAGVDDVPALSRGGRLTLAGIAVTGIVLLAASSLDRQLGLPTFLAGVAASAVVLMAARTRPWPVVRGVSWSVLPLVAGLFVLVQAVENTRVLDPVASLLAQQTASSAPRAVVVTAALAAVLCNLVNNLPLGLLAAAVLGAAHAPTDITGGALIGVDLGPNLSVTGSLATILWLVALRREGQRVTARQFLAVGLLTMPAALLAAVAAYLASVGAP